VGEFNNKLTPVRSGQVRKPIKMSIIGLPSFLCPFFKIKEKDSRNGTCGDESMARRV
jgi:hypothetical protein